VKEPIRVLLAKPGLDGHDRGVKMVAMALQEAGFEVVYTGLRQGVESIVDRALEMKAHVLGLSILSGSHRPLCERMAAVMKEKGLTEVLWLVGGVIPEPDREALTALGVDGVFPFGTPMDGIVDFIRKRLS
jgi:methylmalonyl-CoA mutase C-terminal domain/subunit